MESGNARYRKKEVKHIGLVSLYSTTAGLSVLWVCCRKARVRTPPNDPGWTQRSGTHFPIPITIHPTTRQTCTLCLSANHHSNSNWLYRCQYTGEPVDTGITYDSLTQYETGSLVCPQSSAWYATVLAFSHARAGGAVADPSEGMAGGVRWRAVRDPYRIELHLHGMATWRATL
jgi:hypothetical protein